MTSRLARTAGLHAHPRLQGRDHVGAGHILVAGNQAVAVGVAARQVEQVHAGKGDEEAAKEREGVGHVGRVEALEEDEGGAKGSRGEGDVVEGVDARDALAACQVNIAHLNRQRASSRESEGVACHPRGVKTGAKRTCWSGTRQGPC